MKYYMISWKESDVDSRCFPYIFKSKEDAQRFIEETTYLPSEFEIVDAILVEY